MRIEGTLAVAGVGGGLLLWSQAAHLAGYGFATAAFLSLGGIQSGIRALRAYNRYSRGTEGEDAVLHALRGLPDGYTAIANFVAPGTRQGDMDLLVLGPAGVLVVEIKSYMGRYACHGDSWFAVHADGTRQPLRGSVSRQLKRGRKAIAHYLVDGDVSAPSTRSPCSGPAFNWNSLTPPCPSSPRTRYASMSWRCRLASRPACLPELEALFAPVPAARSVRLPLPAR